MFVAKNILSKQHQPVVYAHTSVNKTPVFETSQQQLQHAIQKQTKTANETIATPVVVPPVASNVTPAKQRNYNNKYVASAPLEKLIWDEMIGGNGNRATSRKFDIL